MLAKSDVTAICNPPIRFLDGMPLDENLHLLDPPLLFDFFVMCLDMKNLITNFKVYCQVIKSFAPNHDKSITF